MRLLSLNQFLEQPDGAVFQIVHRGKAPGALMARGIVTRYEKFARFVAASLAPDESTKSAAYTWPPASGAFTFDYGDSDVAFLVLDRDDVRILAHLLRSPLEAIHAHDHGHVDVPHPEGWKKCQPAMLSHEHSQPHS